MCSGLRSLGEIHLNSSISAFQPSASFLISSKMPSAAKWCGNSQSGRAFILLTNEATAFLSSPRSISRGRASENDGQPHASG